MVVVSTTGDDWKKRRFWRFEGNLGNFSSLHVLKRQLGKEREEMVAFVARAVELVVLSQARPEGVGATVRRSIGGSAALRNFDPFLMLDEFSVKPPAGFPVRVEGDEGG